MRIQPHRPPFRFPAPSRQRLPIPTHGGLRHSPGILLPTWKAFLNSIPNPRVRREAAIRANRELFRLYHTTKSMLISGHGKPDALETTLFSHSKALLTETLAHAFLLQHHWRLLQAKYPDLVLIAGSECHGSAIQGELFDEKSVVDPFRYKVADYYFGVITGDTLRVIAEVEVKSNPTHLKRAVEQMRKRSASYWSAGGLLHHGSRRLRVEFDSDIANPHWVIIPGESADIEGRIREDNVRVLKYAMNPRSLIRTALKMTEEMMGLLHLKDLPPIPPPAPSPWPAFIDETVTDPVLRRRAFTLYNPAYLRLKRRISLDAPHLTDPKAIQSFLRERVLEAERLLFRVQSLAYLESRMPELRQTFGADLTLLAQPELSHMSLQFPDYDLAEFYVGTFEPTATQNTGIDGFFHAIAEVELEILHQKGAHNTRPKFSDRQIGYWNQGGCLFYPADFPRRKKWLPVFSPFLPPRSWILSTNPIFRGRDHTYDDFRYLHLEIDAERADRAVDAILRDLFAEVEPNRFAGVTLFPPPS